MNYTSIEQSKKLLELGLSPESADMIYLFDFSTEPMININITPGDTSIPCWSTEALIALLPIGTHICSHFRHKGIMFECYTEKDRFERLSLFDAVYSMIEWLLKYIY